MINAFCLNALSKYKQFNFNFSECCYLKNKNKTQKQNKRQLQSNIHTEVWPMRGRWWRTQKCLKCHLISKANLRWFYPALPRNRFRGPRDQGVAGDVSENVPCPTTLASNLISPYDLDCPWTWMENIIARCVKGRDDFSERTFLEKWLDGLLGLVSGSTPSRRIIWQLI